MESQSNDINKNEYFEFYQSKSLPIYFAPWWMDASCGANAWDVVLAKNPDGGIEGVFIYHLKKIYSLPVILMPALTSYSGIWYNYPKNIKSHSKISFEKKVMDKLIELLPNHYLFFQQFHPNIENWLPLYWKGYKQTTRYTYQLDLTNGTEEIWDNFKGNVRRNVRKAEASDYSIVEIDDFESFWGPLEKSYKERNKAVPFRKQDLKSVDEVCANRSQRTILVAQNPDGKHLAGIYLVHDSNSSYYLVGYFDPAYKDYAALTLVLWKGIQKMSKKVTVFDFEGSIIPEIEFYFRAFGGKLTPHYKILNTKNKLISLLARLKNPKIFD